MEERNQETATPEPSEDLFEPALGDISEELIQALTPLSSAKKLLVEKTSPGRIAAGRKPSAR